MFESIKTVKQWVVDITTEKDGKTADPARIMWNIGNLVFFSLSIWQCYKHGQFDYQGYAIAFAAIQAGGAAAVKLKETTEQKVVE